MTVQLGHVLVHEDVEHFHVALQQREAISKETIDASHEGVRLDFPLGKQSDEEPKRLFLSASAHHEAEASDKIHTLAIADLSIELCICLEDVT